MLLAPAATEPADQRSPPEPGRLEPGRPLGRELEAVARDDELPLRAGAVAREDPELPRDVGALEAALGRCGAERETVGLLLREALGRA